MGATGLFIWFVHAAFVVSAIVGVISFSDSLSTLRERHTIIWEQLGKPTAWRTDMSPGQWVSVYAYFWSSQYKQLHDCQLDRQARRTKLSALAMIALSVEYFLRDVL